MISAAPGELHFLCPKLGERTPMAKRPRAYITAHWSDNEYENTVKAAKYLRAVYVAGYDPYTPLPLYSLFLHDENPKEHKDGLDMAKERILASNLLVVCGDTIDETMKTDIATAKRRGITVTTLAGILAVGDYVADAK